MARLKQELTLLHVDDVLGSLKYMLCTDPREDVQQKCVKAITMALRARIALWAGAEDIAEARMCECCDLVEEIPE